jgi:hypothetical protein
MTLDTLDQSQPTNGDGGNAAAPFFAVSLLKLTVLSICTLGLYEAYWFYKNWKIIKAREISNISPFWRAFFTPIFCIQCFLRVSDYGRALGVVPGPPPARLLGIAWILDCLAYKLPDPYWIVTMFSFVFMLPIQAYANRINRAVDGQHDPNSRFSAWNWCAVVFGGGFFVLVLIGSLLPDK